MRKVALLSAWVCMAGVLAPAQAAKINLINIDGVDQGTQAYKGFQTAARYWESVLTNDVTINLGVGFASLGPDNVDVLGQTGSNVQTVTVGGWENKIQQTHSSSKVDKLVSKNLPKVNINGAIDMITPGYTMDAQGNINGVDAHSRVFDTDATYNNTHMFLTNANAKALGYPVNDSLDGIVTFNSDYKFDFNPANGIDDGATNFLVVSIHEIGHALGFVSGVDDYDDYGAPNGPDAGAESFDPTDEYWGSSLDMFRYSSNPDGFGDGGPKLDWSIHDLPTDGAALYTNPYFSIDSGDTALFGNLMSRGQFNTNSFQASHWRSALIAGQPFLGIMDPIGFSDSYVTSLDLAAFDAIGWNLSFDVLDHPNYIGTTEDIFRNFAVPEPADWTMMLAGLGIAGLASRRRRERLSLR